MSKSLRALAVASAMVVVLAGGLRAQEFLGEWTFRTRVEPEALSQGSEAAFWNPAGLGLTGGRGEVLVAALQSSDEVGLKGFAAAASRTLRRGTALGVGYQHFGVDDIGRSDNPDAPEQDGTATLINVAEDRLTVSAAQPLARLGWVGVQAEYDRSGIGGGASSGVAVGAGLLLRGGGRLQPQLGASVLTLTGDARWHTGVGIRLPVDGPNGFALRASYGVSGRSARTGLLEHRLSLTASWRDRLILSAGALASQTGYSSTVAPAGVAEFRVNRYALGVVHESVANGFGGVTSVHMGVRF